MPKSKVKYKNGKKSINQSKNPNKKNRNQRFKIKKKSSQA